MRARWLLVVGLFAGCGSSTVEPIDAASGRDAVALDRNSPFPDAAAIDRGVDPVDAGFEDAPAPDADIIDALPADADLEDAAVQADAAAEDAAEQDAGGPPCPIAFSATVTATLRVSADDDRA